MYLNHCLHFYVHHQNGKNSKMNEILVTPETSQVLFCSNLPNKKNSHLYNIMKIFVRSLKFHDVIQWMFLFNSSINVY